MVAVTADLEFQCVRYCLWLTALGAGVSEQSTQNLFVTSEAESTSTKVDTTSLSVTESVLLTTTANSPSTTNFITSEQSSMSAGIQSPSSVRSQSTEDGTKTSLTPSSTFAQATEQDFQSTTTDSVSITAVEASKEDITSSAAHSTVAASNPSSGSSSLLTTTSSPSSTAATSAPDEASSKSNQIPLTTSSVTHTIVQSTAMNSVTPQSAGTTRQDSSSTLYYSLTSPAEATRGNSSIETSEIITVGDSASTTIDQLSSSKFGPSSRFTSTDNKDSSDGISLTGTMGAGTDENPSSSSIQSAQSVEIASSPYSTTFASVPSYPTDSANASSLSTEAKSDTVAGINRRQLFRYYAQFSMVFD